MNGAESRSSALRRPASARGAKIGAAAQTRSASRERAIGGGRADRAGIAGLGGGGGGGVDTGGGGGGGGAEGGGAVAMWIGDDDGTAALDKPPTPLFPPRTALERMTEIKELLEMGLIEKAEFEAKRSQILADL